MSIQHSLFALRVAPGSTEPPPGGARLAAAGGGGGLDTTAAAAASGSGGGGSPSPFRSPIVVSDVDGRAFDILLRYKKLFLKTFHFHK